MRWEDAIMREMGLPSFVFLSPFTYLLVVEGEKGSSRGKGEEEGGEREAKGRKDRIGEGRGRGTKRVVIKRYCLSTVEPSFSKCTRSGLIASIFFSCLAIWREKLVVMRIVQPIKKHR